MERRNGVRRAARRQRTRFHRCWQWMKVFCLLALFLTGSWGVWAGHQQLLHMSYFQVTDIRVWGNSRVSKGEILALGNLQVPMNILGVDLEAIANRIARHPWIRTAFITRELPLSLVINVTERKPEALLLTKAGYLISTDGVVLERLRNGPMPDLPRIRLVWSAEYRIGEVIRDPRIAEALHLWDDLPRRGPLAGIELKEIRVEEDGHFLVDLGPDLPVLRVGSVRTGRQMAHLGAVLSQRREQLDRFTYVDLRFPGLVILKPAERGG
ncbi:MAG: cell division protein FtsQ/DivIB [Candidatus Methylomirabilales bacterium]